MTRSNEETPAEEPLAQQAGLTYARWRCVRRFGKDRDYDDNQRTGNHEGKCLVDREAKLSLPLTPITSQKASLGNNHDITRRESSACVGSGQELALSVRLSNGMPSDRLDGHHDRRWNWPSMLSQWAQI